MRTLSNDRGAVRGVHGIYILYREVGGKGDIRMCRGGHLTKIDKGRVVRIKEIFIGLDGMTTRYEKCGWG